MFSSPFIAALIGGVLIGLSASMLLLFNGRIFGISGIVSGAVFNDGSDRLWRVAIVLGLLTAGLILSFALPSALAVVAERPWPLYALAGLLVGYGTQMGSGCTSGHGVCGISRFSKRSITATITFIGAGMATVAIMRILGSYP